MRKTKIVVPLIIENVSDFNGISVSDYASADIVEWRADFLPVDDILMLAPKVFEKFKNNKILFTIRTTSEGGNLKISDKKYIQMLEEILNFDPDYIDIEYFSHGRALSALTDFRQKIVLSYHNFDEIPTDLTTRLIKMHAEKTAFVKAAVMPEHECDVLDLLQITRDLTLEYGENFITMAMGDLGRISRISGYLTGSCWTFASLEKASAPGQIGLAEAEKILNLLEENLF